MKIETNSAVRVRFAYSTNSATTTITFPSSAIYRTAISGSGAEMSSQVGPFLPRRLLPASCWSGDSSVGGETHTPLDICSSKEQHP